MTNMEDTLSARVCDWMGREHLHVWLVVWDYGGGRLRQRGWSLSRRAAERRVRSELRRHPERDVYAERVALLPSAKVGGDDDEQLG